MIDIIMPIRSTPLNLLRDTLDSVLNQSTQDFQLWICDATPEDWIRWDSYQQLLAEYSEAFGSRWNYQRQTKEGGVAAARNQLLESSSNPLVAFLDSDDLWHPLYLTLMSQALETQEADIWVTEILSSVSSTHLLELQRLGIPAEIGMQKIMHNHLQCYEILNFLPRDLHKHFWFRAAAYFSGLMCRRKCVDTHQFSPEFRLAEDTELMLQWVKADYQVRCLSVDSPLVIKNHWEGQLGNLSQDPEIMTQVSELLLARHSDCHITEEFLATLPHSWKKTFQMFQRDEGARNRYQLNQGMTFNIISRDEWEIMNL
jgi:glycosyltransferase involved in cell wall biosynthesis